MMKKFFVTSTNTDIGKTFISSLLFNNLENPCYFKPVQTGCIFDGENVIVPDLEEVKKLSQNKNYDNFKCSYKLKYELSPHLSCKKTNIKISIDKILNDFYDVSKDFDNIIVEGAGGVYTPLNEQGYYMYNLIKDLNLPCIIVTNTMVGTINNTILTINHLKSNDIKISGIVFNNFTGCDYEIDNINFIKNYSKIENTLIVKNNQKFELPKSDIVKDFIKNI